MAMFRARSDTGVVASALMLMAVKARRPSVREAGGSRSASSEPPRDGAPLGRRRKRLAGNRGLQFTNVRVSQLQGRSVSGIFIKSQLFSNRPTRSRFGHPLSVPKVHTALQ